MKVSTVHAVYIGLVTVLVAMNWYKLPTVSFLFLCGVAIVLYGFTKSMAVVVVTLLTPFLLKLFNVAMGTTPAPTKVVVTVTPAGAASVVGAPVEGFQARDPVSIHQRLEQVKQVAPKKREPTGVLDSPGILDNSPLVMEGMQDMEGEPGVSTPASTKSRNMIYPPSEDSIPSSGQSRTMPPMPNPYLQNGPDSTGVSVALTPNGTKLPPMDTPAGEMAGTETGSMGSSA